MAHDLAIVGCGGFGRETVSIVDDWNESCTASERWHLVGFFDEGPSTENSERVNSLGLSVLGAVAAIPLHHSPDLQFVVAIADPVARRHVADLLEGAGVKPATLISPFARLGRNCSVAHGSIVGSGAIITTNVSIGAHVHVDRGSHIGHDSIVGDFATVHPLTVISGNCTIGSGARLGTHSTVMPGLTVGANSYVGAAACVTRNVAPSSVVKGVPAR